MEEPKLVDGVSSLSEGGRDLDGTSESASFVDFMLFCCGVSAVSVLVVLLADLPLRGRNGVFPLDEVFLLPLSLPLALPPDNKLHN